MPLLMVLANLATAQEATYLDSNLYQPPIESNSMLWTEDAGIAPDGLSVARVESTYIYDPIFETGGDTINGRGSLTQALRLDAIGAAAIRGIQIAADVPIFIVNTDDLFDNPDGSLGDISIDVKGGMMELGEDNDYNIGAGVRLILPTTGNEVGGDAVGVDAVGWEARVVADGEYADALHFAANVGTRGLPGDLVDIDSFNTQLFFRGGLGYDIVENAGLSLDVLGAIDYDVPFEDQTMPVQGILGGFAEVGKSLVVHGGIGSGLIPGTEGDAIRGVIGIGYEPSGGADEDLDTVGNNVDQCPNQAEDLDGFQDEDGCPDIDNDRDNVADLADQCPTESEDMDGLRDDDGCPDEENQVVVRIKDEQGRMLDTAKVTIEKDGQVVKTGSGSFTAELDPGMYTLRAEADHHEPVETTFRVYPDDQVQISATLVESGADAPPESGTEKPHPGAPIDKSAPLDETHPHAPDEVDWQLQHEEDLDQMDEGIEKNRRDIEHGEEKIEKGVEDVGQDVEKGVQDVGEDVEKGVKDVGEETEKGVKDVGEDVEKGEQDVEKELEKLDIEGGKTEPEDLRDERIEETGPDHGEPQNEKPLPPK